MPVAKPTIESCSLSLEAKKMKNDQSLIEANCSVVKSDDCFTLKSKDSSSSPVEASYSKSVQFGPINSTVESNSSFVEEKEFNKIGSLAEPNYSTLKSSDCLNFEKSDLDIIHSNIDLNF